MDFPDAARQAGHVLIDLQSVLKSDLSDQAASDAVGTAFLRINDIGAFTFERGPDGNIVVDATNLMLGMSYLLSELIEKTAEELGDPENTDVVIASLRQMLDEA